MINYDVKKPKLSPRFDLDDIHKIREWSSKRWANATWDEIVTDIRIKTKPIYENNPNYVFDPTRNCYMHYPQKQK